MSSPCSSGVVQEISACGGRDGEPVPYGVRFDMPRHSLSKNKRTQPSTTAVIARRAKPDVAISWYNVRIERQSQEIPTVASLPRNDRIGRLCVCLGMGDPGAQFPPCGGGTPGTAFPTVCDLICRGDSRIARGLFPYGCAGQYSSKLNQVTTFSPYWKHRPSSSIRGRILMPWLSTQGCIRSGW